MRDREEKSIQPETQRLLQLLRDTHAEVGPPAALEAKLTAAFRNQAEVRPAPPRRSGYRAWMAGAIAASLFAAGLWRWTAVPVKPDVRPAVTASAVPPLPIKQAAKAAVVPRAAAAKAVRRKPARSGPPVFAKGQETSPRFLELPFAPALTRYDDAQVIRVKLPGYSMRTMGLPVSEERLFDRVQADILMGNDGIARAVRFVP